MLGLTKNIIFGGTSIPTNLIKDIDIDYADVGLNKRTWWITIFCRDGIKRYETCGNYSQVEKRYNELMEKMGWKTEGDNDTE